MYSVMADMGKKEEERQVQNFDYIENERSFFSEVKSFFHNSVSAFLW